MPPARLAAVAMAAAVAVVASSCSNSQASVNRRPHSGVTTAVAAGGLQVVTVDANDVYRFVPSTIYVHPGRVEIDLVNVGKGAPHDWSLLGFDFTTPLTGTGQHSSVTFTAPSPGSYTYVCTIHRKQGQTGTLVVLPD
jgi:plastocyanin